MKYQENNANFIAKISKINKTVRRRGNRTLWQVKSGHQRRKNRASNSKKDPTNPTLKPKFHLDKRKLKSITIRNLHPKLRNSAIRQGENY